MASLAARSALCVLACSAGALAHAGLRGASLEGLGDGGLGDSSHPAADTPAPTPPQPATQFTFSTQDCAPVEPPWASMGGLSCADYRERKYCTATGDYGPGWEPRFGTFRDWATDNVSAVDACCECGGGSPKASVTFGTTTLRQGVHMYDDEFPNLTYSDIPEDMLGATFFQHSFYTDLEHFWTASGKPWPFEFRSIRPGTLFIWQSTNWTNAGEPISAPNFPDLKSWTPAASFTWSGSDIVNGDTRRVGNPINGTFRVYSQKFCDGEGINVLAPSDWNGAAAFRPVPQNADGGYMCP